jgi:hypothetical protein
MQDKLNKTQQTLSQITNISTQNLKKSEFVLQNVESTQEIIKLSQDTKQEVVSLQKPVEITYSNTLSSPSPAAFDIIEPTLSLVTQRPGPDLLPLGRNSLSQHSQMW